MPVIGIPKEITPGETRVAMVPPFLKLLIRDKHTILIEKGAGVASSFADGEYTAAGATIIDTPDQLYQKSDLILKVQPPKGTVSGKPEASLLKEGSTYMGFCAPLAHPDVIDEFLKRRITCFSMEYVPRITRAQSMDALSSMATVGGYKAVLLATEHLGKMFPLLMTAAGTVPPANVLVVGAGVAGLQAIATAKRLGAKVSAYDVRSAVKEQIRSLGASFVEVEYEEKSEAAGGYAKEQSAGFLAKQREVLGAHLAKMNVVITTAQVFGKKAPVIISSEMVAKMPRGSVIIDMAAEQGGNCELTRAGETIVADGVTIVGAVNLPATVPVDASMMYAKNLLNLLRLMYPKPEAVPDFEDEVIKGACITKDGKILNDSVRDALQKGKN